MEVYRQYRQLKQNVQDNLAGRDIELEGFIFFKDESQQHREDPYLVTFNSHDPNDPKQWPTPTKLFYTSLIFGLVLVTGWASAADSSARMTAAKQYHVIPIVESLATASYLCGVGAGALLAGPLSETVGRNATYFVTFAIFLACLTGSALAPNFATQLVFRTLAGFFASPSMSIFGGSLADMFSQDDRALVWPFFSLSPLLGPTLAPIAGGWLVKYKSWQWVEWTTLLISTAAFALALAFLPETSAPIILRAKARILRQMTGDKRYQSEHEQQSGIASRLKDNVKRIVYFTFREPTTVLFGIYLTLLYVLVFSFLDGFDFIFSRTYNFGIEYRYSAFAAVVIGILLGLPFVVCVNTITAKRTSSDKGPSPELRLTSCLLAAPLLPISLFWLGWTNRPDISYWSSLGACCLFGFSLYILFTTIYHYLLDAYGTNAASAMSAITFMRYYASAGIVIATEPMYRTLTVKYVMTLVGCVAALLAPAPLVFYLKGPTIRKKSKWVEN